MSRPYRSAPQPPDSELPELSRDSTVDEKVVGWFWARVQWSFRRRFFFDLLTFWLPMRVLAKVVFDHTFHITWHRAWAAGERAHRKEAEWLEDRIWGLEKAAREYLSTVDRGAPDADKAVAVIRLARSIGFEWTKEPAYRDCRRCDGTGEVCAACLEMCGGHPNDPLTKCPACDGLGMK